MSYRVIDHSSGSSCGAIAMQPRFHCMSSGSADFDGKSRLQALVLSISDSWTVHRCVEKNPVSIAVLLHFDTVL